MLTVQPNKGDIVRIPQGVITYKAWSGQPDSEFSLSFFEEVKTPTVGIFIEKFNDNVSKIIYQDKIVYVYSEWLYEVRENDG